MKRTAAGRPIRRASFASPFTPTNVRVYLPLQEVGNRVTLNLGLRTEDEKVPTFRPDYLANAFHFTFADKLAPGASTIAA